MRGIVKCSRQTHFPLSINCCEYIYVLCTFLQCFKHPSLNFFICFLAKLTGKIMFSPYWRGRHNVKDWLNIILIWTRQENRKKGVQEWSYRHARVYCITTQYAKTVGQIDELEGRRIGTVFSPYFSILPGEEKKKEIWDGGRQWGTDKWMSQISRRVTH